MRKIFLILSSTLPQGYYSTWLQNSPRSLDDTSNLTRWLPLKNANQTCRWYYIICPPQNSVHTCEYTQSLFLLSLAPFLSHTLPAHFRFTIDTKLCKQPHIDTLYMTPTEYEICSTISSNTSSGKVLVGFCFSKVIVLTQEILSQTCISDPRRHETAGHWMGGMDRPQSYVLL